MCVINYSGKKCVSEETWFDKEHDSPHICTPWFCGNRMVSWYFLNWFRNYMWNVTKWDSTRRNTTRWKKGDFGGLGLGIWRFCWSVVHLSSELVDKKKLITINSSWFIDCQQGSWPSNQRSGSDVVEGTTTRLNISWLVPNDHTVKMERPTGFPDHHRGLHKHHIRGYCPFQVFLSLISSYFWESLF